MKGKVRYTFIIELFVKQRVHFMLTLLLGIMWSTVFFICTLVLYYQWKNFWSAVFFSLICWGWESGGLVGVRTIFTPHNCIIHGLVFTDLLQLYTIHMFVATWDFSCMADWVKYQVLHWPIYILPIFLFLCGRWPEKTRRFRQSIDWLFT